MSVTRLVRSGAALAALVLLPLADSAPVAAQSLEDLNLTSLTYRNVGPSRGGRVTAVAGHRDHPTTFYMGATGGGVWKTTNNGQTWTPIADDYLATGSIGAIRVAPSDSDVVWVGTGSDGIRSNVIVGRGIYRSTDAGETWEFKGLREMGQLGSVEIHPDDPNTVFVAALGNPFRKSDERGVYRTRDGGDTWEQVHFVSDSVGAIDIEFHPENPNVVYAGMWRGERKPWTIISGMQESAREDGIWRSVDGGDTWEYVMLNLPSGLIGKIDLAVTPAAPDRVYALVETNEPAEGLYLSEDRGGTFELLSNHRPLMDRPFYYTNVDVDPTNADVIYVNATQFWRSMDGGETWERRRTPHGDNHDMWINPDNPMIQVQSNDGGANVTLDGGETWSVQYNQPTAELYQVDVDDQLPYWLYAGQQDNSTVMVPSNPPANDSEFGHQGNWKAIGGCETGPAVPKPGDPSTVYSNCKGRFGLYSQISGQERQYYVGMANLYGDNPANLPFRFQRVVPIEVSPWDPNVVYHGSQFVHRTRDGGITWETISPDLTAFRPERQQESGEPITRDITGEEHYSVLYVIEESPRERGVIWTGANDGVVFVTRDNGVTWTDVTPSDLPPEGRVQTIDVSRFEDGKAYVAVYRYLLGDFEPYIYMTDDYGESWARLTDGTNGIPADYPTRVIREDPVRKDLLYAGTEFGMFVSFDDGANWQSFQRNLPVTPITDIEMVNGDMAISTMGRSFWIMDDLSPLRQFDAAVANADAHLFDPTVAMRERRGGGFNFGEPDPSEPVYGPAGVVIDYYLAGAADEVTVEFLDRQGNEVMGFSGQGDGERTESGQEMRAPFTFTVGTPRLQTSAGLHRFVWDMRVHGPGGAARGGPMVVPGDYQVRLTVGDWSDTRAVEITMDPRVVATGVTQADVEAQYEFRIMARDMITDANQVAEELDEALEAAMERNDDRSVEALQELHSRMHTKQGGSYQTPRLLSQMGYLYSNLGRADQRPGQDAYARFDFLMAELEAIKRELEPFKRLVTDR
jgi:photosystem II stability/assembly factor-like uncharacterized protein